VLTLADPAYPEPVKQPPSKTDPLEALKPAGRFHERAGALARLKESARESGWVVDNFRDGGLKAVQLLGERATEEELRAQARGRRIVHLACHGLADEELGNFFGALALTPGKEVPPDPANDGFLTLGEIVELDLRSCELAILSACRTNYGSTQRGEGVWALSRGFLAAGRGAWSRGAGWSTTGRRPAWSATSAAPWPRPRRRASEWIMRRRCMRPSGGRGIRRGGKRRTTGHPSCLWGQSESRHSPAQDLAVAAELP
jgi:hypothetical protein